MVKRDFQLFFFNCHGKRVQSEADPVNQVVDVKGKRERSLHSSRDMQRGRRQSLKRCLDRLTNDDPPLEEDLRVDYIVLRRLNNGRNWVQVDFVDGDDDDGKEWCEGPYHQQTTIRELFGKQQKYDRETRRRFRGITKFRDETPVEMLSSNECDCVESPTSSDDEKKEDRLVKRSVDKDECASDGTDEYVIGEPTYTVPRGAADARQRTLRKTQKRKSRSVAQVVDPPNKKGRRMETRSQTH